MKHLVTATLMFNLGVAGVYAEQNPVKMTYSGTNVATTINLQPSTVTDEELFAGDGTLGSFTFRELHADSLSPGASSTCSSPDQLYIPTLTGAGVFRFHDGSLLTVTMTEGAICVDLTAGVGHLTETYQITGGTRRFKRASGTLILTGLLSPVLLDASGNPALLTNAGRFEGTISGVAREEEKQDERQ